MLYDNFVLDIGKKAIASEFISLGMAIYKLL
jgi:hypothetical protein